MKAPFVGLQGHRGGPARHVQGLGQTPIARPMLCYLDHPLLHWKAERRLGLRGTPGSHPDGHAFRCLEGNDRRALIGGAPNPDAPWWRPPRPRPRRRCPPQPPALTPELAVLAGYVSKSAGSVVRPGLTARRLEVFRRHYGLDGRPAQTFETIARELRLPLRLVRTHHRRALAWMHVHPRVVIQAGLEMGLLDRYGQHVRTLLEDDWPERSIPPVWDQAYWGQYAARSEGGTPPPEHED